MSARLVRNIHGALAVGFAIAIIPVMLTSLRSSVALLQFVSFYAIVVTHAGAWGAGRAEVRAQHVEEQEVERQEVKHTDVSD